MHTQRVAFLSATIVTLAGLTTGCGGHRPSRASASTSAAATSAGAAGLASPAAQAPEQPPFEVTEVTQSGELVWIHFNAELEPQSAPFGVRVYQDTDTDLGGEFYLGSATPWVDPSGRVLLLRAGSRLPNEVRVQLTSQVRARDGRALTGGAFSDAISFEDPRAVVVFEHRFRPGPLAGTAPLGSGALAANTSDDHGDDQGSATLLNQALDGAIEVEADRDWFALDLLGGRSVTLRTETSGDTILTLYDANNSPVATNDDDPEGGRHSRLSYQAPSSGRYFAEVRGYGATTPTYRLLVEGPGARSEAGQTPSAALEVQLGESVGESLGAGDRDHFALQLSAGDPLRVETDHADVSLIALDAQGLAFAEPVHFVASGETLGRIAAQYGIGYAELARLNGIDDPNRIAVGQAIHVPSRDPLALDAPGGRLYVLALGFEGATPDYTISFRGAATVAPPPAPRHDDHGDAAAQASTLTLGVDASGMLEERGDVDWFALDLDEGKTYTFATQTSGDSILRVLDAGGVELAKNDDDPAGGRHSALTFRAAASARHYLEVSGYGQATFGYTLQAALRVPSALPNPARFRPRAGTDVWHVDFRLRADLWAQDLASHGLSSGDAETDRLMRERVEDALLSFLSQKYKLSGDGAPIRGRSWKISFTPTKPSGRPGRNYSREVVGGSHEDGSRTLGVSYLDPGNRRREDNDDLGKLGIFSASIDGRDSTLRPALRASDRRFLDGSYLLGDGSRADDSRFRRIRQVASDWAHALAVVTAHEAGHSVGLDHDESDPRGIMKAALSRSLLSDHATHFADPSALTLDANLDQD